MEPHNERSGITTYALLALGMALFGSATPVSKLVGDAFPALLASTMRMATAVLVLGPIFMLRRRREGSGSLRSVLRDLSRRDWLLLLGIGAIGTFGFTLLLLLGLRIAPGTVGAVVMGSTPAVTAAGAVLFLDDRLDRWKATAIVLAVIGVATANLGTAGDGGGDIWLGSLLVLGAVCCEAAYTLFGKRLSADMTPLMMTLLAALIAGILFVPFALFQLSGFDWAGVETSDWLALGWWGAGTMGLGSILWFHGMMRVSGTTASAFMGVMPVSALLLSYLLLGESFQVMHLVAIVLVLGALAVVTYGDARTEQE